MKAKQVADSILTAANRALQKVPRKERPDAASVLELQEWSKVDWPDSQPVARPTTLHVVGYTGPPEETA